MNRSHYFLTVSFALIVYLADFGQRAGELTNSELQQGRGLGVGGYVLSLISDRE